MPHPYSYNNDDEDFFEDDNQYDDFFNDDEYMDNEEDYIKHAKTINKIIKILLEKRI